MTDAAKDGDAKSAGTFQVLSLSGGGARGLYTIQVLAKLEEYLSDSSGNESYNISQHFDLICGTSIGGILALALAHGRYNAREILKIMNDNQLNIFPQASIITRLPVINLVYKQA